MICENWSIIIISVPGMTLSKIMVKVIQYIQCNILAKAIITLKIYKIANLCIIHVVYRTIALYFL